MAQLLETAPIKKMTFFDIFLHRLNFQLQSSFDSTAEGSIYFAPD